MSAGPLVALQAMDISTDHSCGWAMDPDMVLGSSPSMDDMMSLVVRPGHSDWYGLNGSMVLCIPTWSQIPSAWPSMATEAWDTSAGPSRGRATDPDMLG